MTYFSLLPQAYKYLLSGAAFFAATAMGALVLYEFILRVGALKRALNSAAFIALIALTAFAAASAADGDPAPLYLPWAVMLAVIIPATVYSAAEIATERRRSKNRLSPAAIKETLDDMSVGICFADEKDRIILVNKSMIRTASALIGKYPQSLSELVLALDSPDENSGIVKIDSDLLLFPDGKVVRFIKTEIRDEELEGFVQITAQDVTEPYRVNEKLERENRKLHDTIAEILKMYDRLSDRVREQETLELKIRVHNDIGESLLAVSQAAESDDPQKVGEQLEKLQRALWHFTGAGSPSDDTMEFAVRKAEEAGVTIMADGELPKDVNIRRITVLAARECATNCAKHAHGKTVKITIEETEKVITVSIINDGEPPKAPIKEGGGLSALRQAVEKADGKMNVVCSPRFKLTLVFGKKE